ncbi:CRISPR system Cascade subunit CasA [Salinibacter ruber]|uniref:hypothetical protein n=1 Tax=Salinibacter ruber TaxID=146919 RepID=UPI0021689DEE|nr:hypothetical protein [Salinibacter ruber]MCS4048037.1 CRISPR system Cascade subunit CasA [Salinibacter ruber]
MNLLDDPMLTVRGPEGRQKRSLPQIFAMLFEDEVESFTRLQAHQRQAWHSFLAQLGAIAAEGHLMPGGVGEWREALLDLAPRHSWAMHNEDLGQPAFMQPPVPEDSITDWDVRAPNMSDVPVISQNHAIKARRSADYELEDWTYLLVNQALTGYYEGNYRYGAVRMQSNTASRPFMGTTPSLRWGQHIESDIKRLVGWEPDVSFEYQREVTPLLWTLPPAEGKSDAIDVARLHPLFIDCAKRFRFDGHRMRHTSNRARRVTGAGDGLTGDPWTPVQGDQALNPRERHFGYRQLQKILFGSEYQLPFLTSDDHQEGYLVFQTVSGKKGKRFQYLRRTIPCPYPSDEVFGPDTPVAEEAKARVERAETVASRMMAAAGALFDDKEAVEDIGDRVHGRADDRFFDRLFEAAELEDTSELREFWDRVLLEAAEDIYERLKPRATSGDEKSRWERLAEAEDIFLSIRSDLCR